MSYSSKIYIGLLALEEQILFSIIYIYIICVGGKNYN